MKKKNTGKIGITFLIVSMFLISTTLPVVAQISNFSMDDRYDTIRSLDVENEDSDDVAADIDNKLFDLNYADPQNLNNIQSHITNSKKYAVIIVGRYIGLWQYFRFGQNLKTIQQYYHYYLRDAGTMYSTLQNKYGYDNDSIFLLVTLLPDYFEIPDEFNPDWIDCNSNLANIENILKSFKEGGENELSEQDSLFICFIDHGGNEKADWVYDSEWISPNNRIESKYWKYEEDAYDDMTDTGAVFRPTRFQWKRSWSDWLVLKLDKPIKIKGFRFCARNEKRLDEMEVYFYKGPAYRDKITFTNWPESGWKYYEFEGIEHEVDRVLIRFHENAPFSGFFAHPAIVSEFDFWRADGCGEFDNTITFFGCPFNTISDWLQWIFGYDFERYYDFSFGVDTKYIKAKVIFALQPCCSGGFMSELSGENRIVCTASRGFELALANWFTPFTLALNGTDADGDGYPDADYNNDTKISILEAYRYSVESVEDQINWVPSLGPQHPLIDDNGDGIGHIYYETNYYDPTDPDKDGYLAANTFL